MERTLIEKIMKTWMGQLLSISIFLWGFFTTVVLPLQKLQIQVAQVQIDLNSQGKKYDSLNTAVSALTITVSVLQSRLDNLRK